MFAVLILILTHAAFGEFTRFCKYQETAEPRKITGEIMLIIRLKRNQLLHLPLNFPLKLFF